MTRRGRRAGAGAAAVLLAAAVLADTRSAGAQRPALGPTGIRAFAMARSAEEGAAAAQEEGERALAELRSRLATAEDAEAARALREQAERAHEALLGYRRQAQAGGAETVRVLAAPARDPGRGTGSGSDAARVEAARREVMEERALLAAHEAALMAARARTEAERLRALAAEARALAAERPARSPAPGAGGRTASGPGVPGAVTGGGNPDASRSPGAGGPSAGGVEVPNLVGARLPAAQRDLEAAGLRVGEVTGPRDGFVVRQSPEAGQRAAPGTGVGLTVSGSAATISD